MKNWSIAFDYKNWPYVKHDPCISRADYFGHTYIFKDTKTCFYCHKVIPKDILAKTAFLQELRKL